MIHAYRVVIGTSLICGPKWMAWPYRHAAVHGLGNMQVVHVQTIALYHVFRRVRIRAKSACYLRHFRPSASMYERGFSTGIFVDFDVGDFHVNLSRRSKFG
jgi:hypothetical protein